jgi:Zn-dependent alcohol dehydrogenase
MVGQPKFENSLVLGSMVRNFTGKILTDSQGGQTDPTIDIPRYLNIYRSGKLKLDRLITHRFSLDDINIAIEKIKNGETGRCIIEF